MCTTSVRRIINVSVVRFFFKNWTLVLQTFRRNFKNSKSDHKQWQFSKLGPVIFCTFFHLLLKAFQKGALTLAQNGQKWRIYWSLCCHPASVSLSHHLYLFRQKSIQILHTYIVVLLTVYHFFFRNKWINTVRNLAECAVTQLRR